MEKMIIPKIIHYCWFGGNSLSDDSLRCINSWKKNCPDYKIIEWNEKNFDIKSNVYMHQAYMNKKWAFVSDYVRLKVLYDYGGIYLDTDVELIKNLDRFLKHHAFSGFESDNAIPTGTMGAEKNHSWIENLLLYYTDRKFINSDGSMDLTTNVKTISKITELKYKIVLNNTYQVLNGDVHIYPYDYFCAKNQYNGKIEKSENTYTIHHFSGSWLTPWQRKKSCIKNLMSDFLGENFVKKIIEIKNMIFK